MKIKTQVYVVQCIKVVKLLERDILVINNVLMMTSTQKIDSMIKIYFTICDTWYMSKHFLYININSVKYKFRDN